MSASAVNVEGLWKQYTVEAIREPQTTFYDVLSRSLKAPLKGLRRLTSHATEGKRFWALRDINFEVKPGEVVGIIGRNGAGKSTLLKTLSRITAPTRGRVTVRGRMASLLEVGTGFHPELSGRENIYLNGAILGMRRTEIAQKFDEIVEFAEVADFIDTPVKRYSSGMYVRLAFSVAAHLDADILVVDEVLAVGDAEFQKKCLGAMNRASVSGRSVLVVSHNMGTLARLCKTSLLLDRGQLVFSGDIQSGLHEYAALAASTEDQIQPQFQGPLKDDLVIEAVTVTQGGLSRGLSPARPTCIHVSGYARRPLGLVDIALAFYVNGHRLFTLTDSSEPLDLPEGRFESNFQVPEYVLRPGQYSLAVGARRAHGNEWMWATDVRTVEIAELWDSRCRSSNIGVIHVEGDSRRVTGLSRV
jgi:lipopolysaccharide transport system ATP-binding protein